MTGLVKDDRPPPLPDKWLEEINEKAAKIVEKYPNPVPPVTKKGS